ncbi:MAG: TOBE domain-containing protein, partial [Nitrospira sp.]|nr:TOBE domain-containing protein [Nitrospira sp.]
PLPAGLIPPQPTPTSAVTLGIRPEDIALRESPEAVPVTGTVDLVEDLGADLLLHCQIGALRLVVRTTRRTDSVQGQVLPFYFPLDKLHLFADNRRLDPITTPT